MKIHAHKNHPRFLSNYYRDLLCDGVCKGITSLQGLTAHGRGEAFDYLINEKTRNFAVTAITVSVAQLLLARYPVISVNGNSAILSAKDLVKLAQIIPAVLEINLFHSSRIREQKIANYLRQYKTGTILYPDKTSLANVFSNRKMISRLGQKKADVILIPLEDGDRTLALRNLGKKVITIDLNPLSRTSQAADITIVDNIVRAMPLMIKTSIKLKHYSPLKLQQLVQNYNNRENLSLALSFIRERLQTLA